MTCRSHCWLLALVIVLAACGGGGGGSGDGGDPGPIPRGERLLSIDISLPEDGNYISAFENAFVTDFDQVKLSYDWHWLRDNLDEADPGDRITAAINGFYPLYDVPIVVFIRPIHIDQDERPDSLKSFAFDDPAVIAAFAELIDDFLAGIPAVEVDAIIIGSEIDGMLDSDAGDWAAYTEFFRQSAEHIRTQRPGTRVGSEVTFFFLDNVVGRGHWDALNAHADFVGISYYGIDGDSFQAKPTSSVQTDFATIVARSIAKPIWLPQIGYPAADTLGSSEAQQAAWIRAAFAAWDTQRARIEMVNFTWMHDWSEDAINAFLLDLGVGDHAALAAFLGSLGYRTYPGAGTDKAAWPALLDEAADRDWERVVVTPFANN